LPALWTPACLSIDLPPGVVIPSVCDGADVVVWRSASGTVSAWNDRCQHRGMRLSHGFVRGETLSCIYHGWVYGKGGVCKSIPAHPSLTPPEAIRAQAFSCVETTGLIWLAPKGIETLPPDFAGFNPVRSIVINCTFAQLQDALPKRFHLDAAQTLSGTISVAGDSVALALAMQRLPEGRLKMHTLSKATEVSVLVAISRWLENLRREMQPGVPA
jgi:nitrite reductase/ring-hydroxylating ferredoxin subunit